MKIWIVIIPGRDNFEDCFHLDMLALNCHSPYVTRRRGYGIRLNYFSLAINLLRMSRPRHANNPQYGATHFRLILCRTTTKLKM